MATKVPRRLNDLIDVDTAGVADGDRLTYDVGSGEWVPGAPSSGAGGSADEVTFTPAGSIAATDVQAALEELDTEKASASTFADHSARHENGGADEISVAGLSGLLADSQTPLAHVHDGADITTGTIADARIASTIARDSEVTAAITAHEGASDPHPVYVTGAEATTAILAALAAADGAGLSDDGAGVLSVNVDGSTLEISSDSLRVKDGGITIAKLSFDPATQTELDAHVNDSSAAHAASAVSADSTTLVGTGTDVQAVLEELDNGIADHLADTSAAHAASAISFSPTGSIAATDVQAAIAEAASEAGVPNLFRSVYGAPATAFDFDTNSLTGLTQFNSPDTCDAHTTVPGHLFLEDDESGENMCGVYATAPSAPFTVAALLDIGSVLADSHTAGLFIGSASPGQFDILALQNAARSVFTTHWNSPTSFSGTATSGMSQINVPIWLAIRVNSNTDVDFLYSMDGVAFKKYTDSRNPGFTAAVVGLAINANAGGVRFAAAFDWLYIYTSALTFKGANA